MKKFTMKMIAPLALFGACGCSSNFLTVSVSDEGVDCRTHSNAAICQEQIADNHVNQYQFEAMPDEPTDKAVRDPSLFSTGLHFNLLNDYVEQMALDIRQDLVDTRLAHPIAVASFVHLDANLKSTNVLGNQIAEQFITELRDMGLAVNDHKVTGNLEVTPQGDFAFSRNNNELKPVQNVGYVLTGTMIKQMNGILINARVVGLTSNMVVASSSKLIPNSVL